MFDFAAQSARGVRPTGSQLTAVSLPILLTATMALGWHENQCYAGPILRLSNWQLDRFDRGLIFTTIVAKSLVLLAAPVIVALLTHRRTGTVGFWLLGLIIPAGILCYLATDLKVRVITGQSLAYYLHRIIEQNGLQWGGDGRRYLMPLMLPLMGGLFIIAIALILRRRVEGWIAKVPPAVASVLAWTSCCVAMLIVLGVCLLRPFAGQPAALQRLHQQFPTTAFLFSPHWVQPTGETVFGVDVRPQLSALALAIDSRSHRGDIALFEASSLPPDRPNIVLLILESFRSDSINPRSMPKLNARSKAGFKAERHLSGSNCSPQGAFALLYGQHATTYDAVLDAGHRPVLCERWEAAGYRTSLVASCIFDYRRMDEMFGDRCFNEVVTFPRSASRWPDADVQTLSTIADQLDTVRGGTDGALLAVGYLMSTHYDYQYPDRYASTDTGVASPPQLNSPGPSHLATNNPALPDGLSRENLSRRYARSLKFMDDELDRFLRRVDLNQTVVVITGDHGESLYDDGVLSHGSRLSEIQTQTPLLILGCGVKPHARRAMSSHVDLIPTLWNLCGGEAASEGDLLFWQSGQTQPQTTRPPDSGLLVHEYPDSWDLMVIQGDKRLLANQSRTQPRLSVLGFAGRDGLVDPAITSAPDGVTRWLDGFIPLTR